MRRWLAAPIGAPRWLLLGAAAGLVYLAQRRRGARWIAIPQRSATPRELARDNPAHAIHRPAGYWVPSCAACVQEADVADTPSVDLYGHALMESSGHPSPEAQSEYA